MDTTTSRNVHIPLPKSTYLQLKKEAKHSKQPVTKVVRYAIEQWLEQRQAQVIEEELTEYVSTYAGTKQDLDPDLEKASIEHLTSKGNDLNETR